MSEDVNNKAKASPPPTIKISIGITPVRFAIKLAETPVASTVMIMVINISPRRREQHLVVPLQI